MIDKILIKYKFKLKWPFENRVSENRDFVHFFFPCIVNKCLEFLVLHQSVF